MLICVVGVWQTRRLFIEIYKFFVTGLLILNWFPEEKWAYDLLRGWHDRWFEWLNDWRVCSWMRAEPVQRDSSVRSQWQCRNHTGTANAGNQALSPDYWGGRLQVTAVWCATKAAHPPSSERGQAFGLVKLRNGQVILLAWRLAVLLCKTCKLICLASTLSSERELSVLNWLQYLAARCWFTAIWGVILPTSSMLWRFIHTIHLQKIWRFSGRIRKSNRRALQCVCFWVMMFKINNWILGSGIAFVRLLCYDPIKVN